MTALHRLPIAHLAARPEALETVLAELTQHFAAGAEPMTGTRVFLSRTSQNCSGMA